jgi:hypothetical protein
MIGLTAVAVPFLWYFGWAGWAWLVVAIACVLVIGQWLSEALKIHRENQAVPAGPFKSDFVRDRPAASSQSSAFKHNDDEYIQGETIWTGSKQIRFNYRNTQGEHSDREVTVHKVVANADDLYFVGLCHLRNEPRTFRLDRVHPRGKVTDTATGEINTLRKILGVKRRVSRR